jgi:hypothetical protein
VGTRNSRLDLISLGNKQSTAAIPPGTPRSQSIAVDWTSVESWGVMHGDRKAPEVEWDAEEPLPEEEVPRRKAKVLGKGPDGRNVYTADPDARIGYRSATSSRPAGLFPGYYLHTGVQTRDVRSTNYIDDTRLGPPVPPVMTTWSLTPAGYHPAKAIIPQILSAQEAGQDIENTIFDRGYSQLLPETWQYPLLRGGIQSTFDLKQTQRGPRPFGPEAQLVDGTMFSIHLPHDLGGARDWGEPNILPTPPMGSTVEEKKKFEDAFNRRARWRYGRHAGPFSDGTTRWASPFRLGLLRSREIPRTMRRSKTTPLEILPKGDHRCCSRILTVTPAQLPLWQEIPYGTTAWRISYGRRNLAETGNSALKSWYSNVGDRFSRVMATMPKKRKERGRQPGITLAKIALLITPFIAAYNLYCVRSFLAKQELNGQPPWSRKPRRVGTWRTLLPSPSPTSTSPP